MSVAAASIYNLLGVPNAGFNTKPFVTSWILPNLVLACIRLIISIYCFGTIIFSWIYFATHRTTYHLRDIGIPPTTITLGTEAIGLSFGFFNYMSYWGLAFYFAWMSFQNFTSFRGRPALLDYWSRSLQAMHTILYSSVVCFPILVSAVYWGTMWAPSTFEQGFTTWNTVSLQILNLVFALFEIFATRTPPMPWFHLIILLVVLLLHLGVVYIIKATTGLNVYLWMNPDAGIAQFVGHIVGYACLTTIIFIMVRGLIWVRCRMTKQPIKRIMPDFQSSSTDGESDIWIPKEFEIMKNPRAKETTVELGFVPDSVTDKALETSKLFQNAEAAVSSAFIKPPIPPPPPIPSEPVKQAFPKRSSSFHVRNFARPQSVMKVSAKLQGFWL